MTGSAAIEDVSNELGLNDYVIKRPTTTHDDGSPSDSIKKDCERICEFVHDERHIVAYKLYQDILRRLKENMKQTAAAETDQAKNKRKLKRLVRKNKSPNASIDEFEDARIYLAKHRQLLETLEKRAGVFKRARKALQKNDDWILSQTLFGVTTYYRREKDNSLSIKMEGKLEGVPIFEQVAVLKEVDLHCKWAPFCSSSMTIKDLNKLDTVGWFCVGLPHFGMARDGCFRAIGCDNMMEDGSIIVVGQGVNDRSSDVPFDEPFLTEGVDGLEFPDPPTRLGSGRLTIKNFSAVINVLSADTVETKLVANIDPNLSLIPQSLIDFIMKKLCGVLLSKLQGAAKRAAKDPVHNAHAKRMRQEHAFYQSWLLPKFQAYCGKFNWEMPTIAAFNLTDGQLEQENMCNESRSQERGSSYTSSKLDFSPGQDIDSPRSMTQDSDDQSVVSNLSMSSSSTRNPIMKYLKEIERKTSLRKKKKIKAARQVAANRLKPKAMNDEELERLNELKAAKARSIGKKPPVVAVSRSIASSTPTTTTTAPTRKSFLRRQSSDLDVTDVMERFHTHTKEMRFATMFGLIAAMTVVLSPEVFKVPVARFLGSYSEGWVGSLILDVLTFVYLVICAGIHFVVCDVSLVYAFDALELGMKTGKQIKRFYSDTVRYVVAGGSCGIVALSSGKAIALLWTRVGVWYTTLGAHSTFRATSSLWKIVGSYVPASVISLRDTIWSAIAFAVGCIASVVNMVLWLVHTLFIRSNWLGQTIEKLALWTAAAVPYLRDCWNDYIEDLAQVYEGSKGVITWREDAISSARFWLSYTAVFLLTVLVLFNVSSQQDKKRTEEKLNQSMSSLTEESSLRAEDDQRDYVMESFELQGSRMVGEDDQQSIATTIRSNRSARTTASVNTTGSGRSTRSMRSLRSVLSNRSSSSRSSLKKKLKNPFKRKKKNREITSIPEMTEIVVK